MPQTGEKWANVLRRGHVPKSVVSPLGRYFEPLESYHLSYLDHEKR